MATESFGASFGNPSKYMGSSPLGEIWKGLKTGASVYAMQKTGLTDYLDKLGVKQKDGVFSFGNNSAAAPAGAVVPPIDQVPQAGGPMTYGNQGAPIAGAMVPDGIAQVPQAGGPLFSSYNPTTMKNVYGVNTGTNKEFAPVSQTVPVTAPVPMPRLTGEDILGGKISVANPNDNNPAEGGGYTDQLASGSEYTEQPGYMKMRKVMASLFGGAQA